MSGSKFSYFKGGINTTKTNTAIDLAQFFEIIVHSDDITKKILQNLRSITDPDKLVENKRKKEIKQLLDYVTPAGIFTYRNEQNLKMFSGYAPIDIDHISSVEETIRLKNILKQDEYVAFIFISPSGVGLKLIIKIPIDDEKDYKKYVKSFYAYLHNNYGVNISNLDSRTHDISRACFISHDPEAYMNQSAEIFTNKTDFKDLEKTSEKDTSRSAVEYKEIIKLLYAGKDEEYIYKHMNNFTKWITQGHAYQEHTFRKAKDYVEKHAPDSAQVKLDIINIIAEDIVKQFKFAVIRSDKQNPETYMYRDGIYSEYGGTFLSEYIKRRLGKYFTKNMSDKIKEKVYVDSYVDAVEFFKEEDPRFICVQNGIVDLFENKLIPFTPDLKFFNKLPVVYDASKKCETTIKHFQTVLQEKDIPLMQELYGFLLYRDYLYQKAFIFSGEGSNGKTMTLTQIRNFIGINNCVNISLFDLENQHFMKSNLFRKLANIADDIGKAEISDSKSFKELVGDGMITADRKNTTSVTFTNYAKMIFNANTIPAMADKSDGNWRRWCFVRFETQFLEEFEYDLRKQNNTLSPKHRKKDYTLKDKLITPDELSGVLNWAIEGFQRLRKNQAFSYKKSINETKQEIERYSSNVVAFYQDCLEKVPHKEQYEVFDDMFEKYLEYCQSKPKFDGEQESKTEFRKLIEKKVSIVNKRLATGYELRMLYVKFKGIPRE